MLLLSYRTFPTILARISCILKRHHDDDNSYKEKHNWVAHSFRDIVHYHHAGILQLPGRHGARKEAESRENDSFLSKGNRK